MWQDDGICVNTGFIIAYKISVRELDVGFYSFEIINKYENVFPIVSAST